MLWTRPPFFLRWMSPRYLWCDLPSDEKVIYLTFDDGPVPDATPEVLDILDRFGAKATFFMVGANVVKHPDEYNRVCQAGHRIGNHTYHHLNGWHTAPGAYMDDVKRCREVVDSRLFRPPYGLFTPTQYLLLNKEFRFVLWSVLTYDFDRKISQERCLATALGATGPGSIVVFHDSPKAMENLRFALPRFLELFTSRGYEFRALPSD